MKKKILTIFIAIFLGAVLLSGCAQDKGEKVMWLGDLEVYNDEYQIYLNNEKMAVAQSLGQPYETVKNYQYDVDEKITFGEVTEQNAKNRLLVNKMCEQLFNEKGLKVDNEMNQQIEEIYDRTAENAGGKEKYEALLKQNGLTVKDQKRYIKAQVINDTLAQSIYGEGGENELSQEELLQQSAETLRLVKPITIKKIDENKVTLPQETLDQKQEKYNELKQKLEAGEDFDQLFSAYNEEPLTEQEEKNGKLINIQSYDEPDLRAVVEHSQPGEIAYGTTDVGFYAVKVLPIDASTLAWGGEEIRNMLMETEFQKLIEEELTNTPYHFYI